MSPGVAWPNEELSPTCSRHPFSQPPFSAMILPLPQTSSGQEHYPCHVSGFSPRDLDITLQTVSILCPPQTLRNALHSHYLLKIEAATLCSKRLVPALSPLAGEEKVCGPRTIGCGATQLPRLSHLPRRLPSEVTMEP